MNGVTPLRPIPSLDDLRKDWVIAYTSLSEGYVGRGKSHAAGLRVTQAYAMLGGYQVSQQGAGRVMILTPIEFLADHAEVNVRPVSELWFHALSDADFKAFAPNVLKNIEAAENMRTAIRSQRSGIVVAPSNIKLPPAPGGRS